MAQQWVYHAPGGPIEPSYATPYAGRSAAQADHIPSAVNWLWLAGYASAGDGGQGLYVRKGSAPTYPLSYFQSADGAYWLYIPDDRGVNAKAFGAVADGVIGNSYSTYSGTDNAPAIQAAIDYATYSTGTPVYLPAGLYLINSALQLGYGATTRETIFEGDGSRRRGDPANSGTVLLCNFSNQPAIAVNGQRRCRIRRIAGVGKNYNWITTKGLGGSTPSLDDKQISNWLDPALDPNANSRYAPYAFIVIDPYAGAQPTPAYPAVTYPSWSGIVTQYNKLASSQTLIDDVYMAGFVAAVAIQPNADGNGDFIKFREVGGEYCAYLFSAGNSQGRLLSILNSSFNNFHTGFCNTAIGAQIGQFDLYAASTDFDAGIQIFNCLQGSDAGPCKLASCYAESLYSLGTFGQSERATSPLEFESCKFNFSGQNNTRGWAPFTLVASASAARVVFRGTFMIGYQALVMSGYAPGFQFVDCLFQNPAYSSAYQQIATSFLCGGLMLVPSAPQPFPEAFSSGVVNSYNISTGAVEGAQIGAVCLSDRAHPLRAWSNSSRSMLQQSSFFPNPNLWTSVDKSTLVSCSLSGTTLTMVFSALSDQVANYTGRMPGDVCYDVSTGSVFFIRSRSGTTVLAELQNNYTFDGTTYTPINAFSTSTGALWFGLARAFLPEKYLKGDFSTANANIANAGTDDNSGTWIVADNQVLASDWLLVDVQKNNVAAPANSLVASVTSGNPATIALSGNALKTVTDIWVGFFIRQAPANV